MKFPDMGLGGLFEMTFLLILVYLLLRNADGLATALNAFTAGYTKGVKALQGS